MILGLNQNSPLPNLQKWHCWCDFGGCAPLPRAPCLHTLITVPWYSWPLDHRVTPSLHISWVRWARKLHCEGLFLANLDCWFPDSTNLLSLPWRTEGEASCGNSETQGWGGSTSWTFALYPSRLLATPFRRHYPCSPQISCALLASLGLLCLCCPDATIPAHFCPLQSLAPCSVLPPPPASCSVVGLHLACSQQSALSKEDIWTLDARKLRSDPAYSKLFSFLFSFYLYAPGAQG